MHDRPRRLVAACLSGLILAGALAVPVGAASPHPARARKAEPRRVAEYRPNRAFTPDTDLLSTSGYAAWMIDELLQATTPLPRLGASFTRAERETGINARYLVAHAMLETGWGTSWITRAKHNLFGYGAYDRDPLRYAVRFPSFDAGIAAVTDQIRTAYLSPDGRWWRGFPTLRGVNRFYASDARWADKIAVLANAIDAMVVTLRERGLRFGTPRIAKPAAGGPVAAGSSIAVEIPWTSRRLGLPAGIRFAVRWVPVALAEGGPTAPDAPPTSTWTAVARVTRAGRSVSLVIATPITPGSWRLEIEARDSDGRPLPATDVRPIRALGVRVAAVSGAEISVGLDVVARVASSGDATMVAFAGPPAATTPVGGLTATIRNVGRTTIPAIALDGTPTLVEAWSLPLAADDVAVQLASVPLVENLPPGGRVAIELPRPERNAVVVLRLSGDADAIGRSVPAVVLVSSSADGGVTIATLSVPDVREGSPASPGLLSGSAQRADQPASPPPTVASVSVRQGDGPGEVAIGLVPESAPGTSAPAEPPSAPPSVLVRTIATLPASGALPTSTFLPWPGYGAGDAILALNVAGVPAGIRLVIVALVPGGGSLADPATLHLAWVPVDDPGSDPTPR